MSARPRDYAAVVRAHHAQTTAYLVASREPCLTIRADEIKNVRRRLVAIDADALATLEPGASWILAAIVCAAKDVAAVAAWLAKRRRDAARVWLFVHPDVDVARAFAPWRDAALPDPQVDFVRAWDELHPIFGKALNDQVYADFA